MDWLKIRLRKLVFSKRLGPIWNLLLNKQISSGELRKTFVHSHGLALLALGKVGYELIKKHPDNWKNFLGGLKQIDWLRSNSELWEGRAMHAGRITASSNNVLLTAMIIKRSLDLKLTKEDEELENRLLLTQKETD